MALTNIGLVEQAKKALAENWGYCLGGYGQILTSSVLKSKCSQAGGVGEYNTAHLKYLEGFLNKKVSDCYGLVKSYVWDNGGVPKYNSNGCTDRNQESAYTAAKIKGALATMPELPGVVLKMAGHCGIYIGNGEFIECAGAPTGMRKGRISNGKVTSGSNFTNWFLDTYINYDSLTVEQAIMVLKNEGVVDTPSYWLEHYKDVEFLDKLIIKSALRMLKG